MLQKNNINSTFEYYAYKKWVKSIKNNYKYQKNMELIKYIKNLKNDAKLMIGENTPETNFYYKAQISAYNKILKYINKK